MRMVVVGQMLMTRRLISFVIFMICTVMMKAVIHFPLLITLKRFRRVVAMLLSIAVRFEFARALNYGLFYRSYVYISAWLNNISTLSM